MTASVDPTYYADFNGLESLKAASKGGDQTKAMRAAARQFESLFTDMLLKSMRTAKLGDGLGDSQATDMYTDMYDQQLALSISQGKGLGLADMLVQQLVRNGFAKGANAAATTGAAAASGASASGGAASSGVTTAAPAGGANVSRAQRISFVQAIEPYAQQAASALGVSCDTVIGQAALETGWGSHMPVDAQGNASCNLFGVKSGAAWNGTSIAAPTTEYLNGVARSQTQGFRAYGSVGESMRDYVAVLRSNSRYAAALGTGDNTTAFASALQRGGYATDPAYAQKLESTTAAVRALRNGTDSGAAATDAALKISAGLPTTSGGETS